MKRALLLALAAIAVGLVAPPTADAHPEYQKAFQNEYTKGAGIDKAFRTLVRKAKCYVCHQGEDRKNYNRYGLAMTAHLKEGDKKNKKKIAAALAAVAAELSAGEGSAPYADLIAAGELPGGSIEDSKKEPVGKASAEVETDADSGQSKGAP